jgi:4-hydroxythreonine-4-phosphate dehydrogenase
MQSRGKRIGITTGDADGIGLEITTRALLSIGPQPGYQYLVWRSPLDAPKTPRLSRKFKIFSTDDLAEALAQPFRSDVVLEIKDRRPPHDWVIEAALLCQHKFITAMVTGPMSKIQMQRYGRREIGHTELLAQLNPKHKLFMGFVGSEFSVVLATGHIPLSAVTKVFNQKKLRSAIQAAMQLLPLIPRPLQSKPMGIVGVNPHAGENGIIGGEEAKWLSPTIKRMQRQGFKIVGPLVPDAAFLPPSRQRHSLFICPYHDQGLIPFKITHGFSQGVHITLGLPFIRTSVDHGTAKDLYGRGVADFGSMADALRCAMRLTKRQPQMKL